MVSKNYVRMVGWNDFKNTPTDASVRSNFGKEISLGYFEGYGKLTRKLKGGNQIFGRCNLPARMELSIPFETVRTVSRDSGFSVLRK